MGKRFLLYIDGYTKPIAITDPNENRDIDELSKVVTEMITGVEMCNFSTENDSVIVKPSHIKAVYIANILNTTKATYTKREDIVLDFGDIEEKDEKDDTFEYYDEKPEPAPKDSSFFESATHIPNEVLDVITTTKKEEPKRKGRPPKKQEVVAPTPSPKPEPSSEVSAVSPIIHEQRYVPLKDTR